MNTGKVEDVTDEHSYVVRWVCDRRTPVYGKVGNVTNEHSYMVRWGM